MIEQALEALKQGKVILLYDFDNREKETDFAILSSAVTPETIRMFRKDGGGLICTAISGESAKAFGLPFASDALRFTGDIVEKEGDVPYDRRNHSSFSLWVNHRDTYTGVTDRDRALTVTSIARYVRDFEAGAHGKFSDEFRTPGHMALLRAADGLLDQRRGQTELSVALADMAGVTPAVTICEMMADDGFALDKEGAKAYAKRHGLIFIEGQEVLDEWERRRATA
ncbi:Riboflavin biosynthesis protein RibBA [Methanocorpusculaceae archaeon Sp1]|nr:Riboflavin biosynthesis protein RibBA [Methanocorpusculaceae archaeon Sp1]